MKHTKIFFVLAAMVLFVACGDANERYVRKAVKIMDRQGLYAQGEQWEAAKAEALAAHPASHEEAVATVQKALKVAGGKHSFIMSADEVTDNDTSAWAMPSVELRDGIAYVNGLAERGNYSFTRTDPRPEGVSFPLILRQGEVFVLGDKREDAVDSRLFGPVRVSELLGRPLW